MTPERQALAELVALHTLTEKYNNAVPDSPRHKDWKEYQAFKASFNQRLADAWAAARAVLERHPRPEELPPSLALRAWTALSEVDYEFDPPQRIVDLMYELQLAAQGRPQMSADGGKDIPL